MAVNFGLTAIEIRAGGFDHVALPKAMISQEFVGNALEALGWGLAVIFMMIGKNRLAAKFAIFLAGMLFFDVQTTWTLEMPIPDGFLYWGSALALLQLLSAIYLLRTAKGLAANA